jgi:LysR family hydrogen peroxide-inducible transcriptional activator
MEVHQLRYFVAVAETGSFTRAAERCAVAQPSLSQQIRKLENELNRPLFDRLGRCVRLTDAGQRLLDRARTVLATMDEAARELREQDGPGRGHVSVGAIPTIGPYLLPPVLARFLRRYPDAQVMLREDVTTHLVAALHEGDLDLALAALPVDDPQLHEEVLFSEPLLAGLPAGHPLTRKRRLARADLQDQPFLLLTDVHCLSAQVSSYCQPSFAPRVTCRFAQLSTIQQMIGLGLGISLVPKMACPVGRTQRLVYRGVGDPEPARTVGILWHRHRYMSPTVRLFRDLLVESARGRSA